MQSALGSLRQTEPTKRIAIDNRTSLWGVGCDGLSLSGHYEFQVIKGSVTICGIVLNAGSSTYMVNAPIPPYPILRTLYSTTQSRSNDDVRELAEFSAVVKICELQFFDFSDLAPPFKQLWHSVHRRNDLPNLPATESSLINIPRSWQNVEFNASQSIVLGPKNSGKSSFARYVSNQLLLKDCRVFFLELDPGQPEFTVPGCISLRILDKLNFSPGYFHPEFQKLVKCFYLGYVSPVDSPDRYLELCNMLLQAWRDLPKKANDKLIVNTSGWTKGLGLELNKQVVNMFDPDTEIFHIGDSTECDFEYNVTSLESIGDNTGTTITSGGFSAAELRSLQLMLYLHGSDPRHLTEWTPYEVDLDKVGWLILDHDGIDVIEDFAICVEGCLMAICICEDPVKGIVSGEPSRMLQYSSCVGILVVQSIDKINNTANLLLPYAPRKLGLAADKHVVLIRGRVNLPIWEVHNRKLGNSPWINTEKAPGIGGSYTKFRRNIQR